MPSGPTRGRAAVSRLSVPATTACERLQSAFDGRSTAVPAGVTSPVQALADSVQTFPLTYQSPLARLSVRITPKLRWNAGWQFYSYGEDFHILGYNQNYHAHTGFTSVLWSF